MTNLTNTGAETRRSFIEEFAFGDKDKAFNILIEAARTNNTEDERFNFSVNEYLAGIKRLAKALGIEDSLLTRAN